MERLPVIDGFAYTVDEEAPTNWAKLQAKTQLAVGDTTRKLFLNIVDSNKDPVNASCGYTLESSDPTVFMIAGDVINAATTGVQITTVGQGSAYVLVKDVKGNVVKTLPITVGAKRVLTSVSYTNANIMIADTASGIGSLNTVLVVKDQYGDVVTGYTGSPVPKSWPTNADKTAVIIDDTTVAGVTNVSTNQAKAGTYTFVTEVVFQGVTKQAAFNVTVVNTATGKDAYAIAFATADDTAPITDVSTTVAKKAPATSVSAYVVVKRNGVITGYAPDVNIKSIDIAGNGKAVAKASSAAGVSVSCAAIDSTTLGGFINQGSQDGKASKVTVLPAKNTSAQVYEKYMAAGAYSYVLGVVLGTDETNLTATLTIKDDQAPVTAKVLRTKAVGDLENDIETYLADKDNCKFFYDGMWIDMGQSGNSVDDVEVVLDDASTHVTAVVKTATITFEVPGSDDGTTGIKSLTTVVPVNQVFYAN